MPLQAYEVLELFVELLAVRVHLIEKSKERPQDMNEALGTLVYAAARIQVLKPVLVPSGPSPAVTSGSKQRLTCVKHWRLLTSGSSCTVFTTGLEVTVSVKLLLCLRARRQCDSVVGAPMSLTHCEQDFPELLAIRAQLAAKYGKEFIQEASSDISCLKWNVNENMIRRARRNPRAAVRANLNANVCTTATCSMRWGKHLLARANYIASTVP